MKMRVITAVVALPLLLLLLLAAPTIVVAVVAGFASAIAAYELTAGTGLVKHPRLSVYSMVSAFWCALWCGLNIGYAWLLLGVILFWAALFSEMMLGQMKLTFDKTAICFAAGVLLPMLLTSLVRIHNGEHGRAFVLIPFIIAFMSDSGAYFAGLKFGKHKLAPTISPKKTVEGVVGGVISAVFGMVVYCLILDVFLSVEVNYIYAIIYGMLGSVAAVFGDLCFSIIKRQTGIKDYGKIIPGHGGMLDRLDSMIVVGPLAEVLLLLLPLAV